MIEGNIINLRAQDMGDLPRAFTWVNDREVTRYLAARYPWPLAAEEEWLKGRTSKPVSYDNAHFAIETKDGAHIGHVGFHFVRVENRKAHLGIAIGDKAYWSKGYGTDAMLTLLRFGFDEMNLNRIELYVNEDNERARACYRKCGFVEEGMLRQAHYRRGGYTGQVVMSVLREEWYTRQAAAGG